jgi:hypothetical protein
MRVDSIQLAHKIAFGDVAGGLPDGAHEWLQAGLRHFLMGNAKLEVALGLTGAQEEAARNRALQRAAEVIDGGRSITPWKMSFLLEDAIKRFESGPLVQINRGLPVELSKVNECLFEAYQVSSRRLRSARRLYELLLLTNSP